MILQRTHSKGFTLIELLIVIALIGALVVGLLAALDPIDQIRRGADVGAQNMAKEYLNAQTRFYANNLAWAGGNVATTTALTAASGTTAVTALVTAGELKSSFPAQVSGSNGANVSFNQTAAGTIEVYYRMQSKAFKNNPSIDKCTAFGTCGVTAAACAAAADCYGRIQG